MAYYCMDRKFQKKKKLDYKRQMTASSKLNGSPYLKEKGENKKRETKEKKSRHRR